MAQMIDESLLRDREASVAPTVSTVALFALQVGATILAVDVAAVTSVVEGQPAVPIPRVPAHIRGFAVVADRAVVVVDLALLLGLQRERDPERRLVLVSAAGLVAALDVDRALGVQRVARDAIHAPRALSGERLLEVVTGEIDGSAGLVGVIDAGRLLTAARVAHG